MWRTSSKKKINQTYCILKYKFICIPKELNIIKRIKLKQTYFILKLHIIIGILFKGINIVKRKMKSFILLDEYIDWAFGPEYPTATPKNSNFQLRNPNLYL